MKQVKHMPRSVAQRVMRRFAAGERAVVLVGRKGKPSSVWGYEEYKDRKALANKVKPWERRRQKAAVPDPLGAVDGTVLKPIRREYMYE